MVLKYFIKTFGCAQNEADSERIASMLESRGMKRAKNLEEADHIVINTCMIREMAENRVYGLINNLRKLKSANRRRKIVLTGCMVGMAVRDKSGKFMKLLRSRLPGVDEFLPIEEVGFDHAPIRNDTFSALVPVSNGCNNFCTFCVVPYSRGREVSRPYDEIIEECKRLVAKGYKKITLLGMNVNSYGADLLLGPENVQVLRDINKPYFRKELKIENFKLNKNFKLKIKNYGQKPTYVKHLGRYRIPTLFPQLLEDVAKINGIELIDFMSSNPWDFSEDLIKIIAGNPNITRTIHLPVQSGSNSVLRRMNRWYTREEYLELVEKLKDKNLKLSTDIIVGFCGETEKEFLDTLDLVKKVGFYKAYIAMYSDRPMTAAHKVFKDNVPHVVKKNRWRILEELINKPNA